jgi:uncharacterized protein (TIGR00730 family)
MSKTTRLKNGHAGAVDTTGFHSLTPVMQPRSVCVYCGSGKGLNPAYAEGARALGTALASNGIRLVYGAGSSGLMGEVARATLAAGGYVTGIIPESLMALEKPLEDVNELIRVDTLHTRKMLMYQKSDAFVALPGGIGTLEELVEQLTWVQLGHHGKPVIIADIDGYWQPLLGLIEAMRAQTFIRDGLETRYTVVTRGEDIVPELLRAFPALEGAGDALQP